MIYGLTDIARDLVCFPARVDNLRAEEYWALRNISLTVEPGECIGVIGPNGAGKSTLLKLVGGIYPPDTGRIRVRPRVGTLLEVGAGFHPLLSGRENIFINGSILGLKNQQIRKRLDEIVAFADLEEFIDSPVKHYSSGMYVRLGFAVAAHLNPDVFLVDEALAVGDTAFRIKCINRIAEMREEGTAILFVSHSEMQVRMAASRCLLINHSKAETYDYVDEAFLSYQNIINESNSAGELAGHADYYSDVELIDVKLKMPYAGDLLISGDPINVQLRFNVHTPVSDAHIIMRVWTAQGELAATVNSRDAGTSFNLPCGEASINIALDQLPLVPGKFRFAGGLLQKNRIIAWSTQLAWLHIKSKSGQLSTEGIMALSAQFEMKSRTKGIDIPLHGNIIS